LNTGGWVASAANPGIVQPKRLRRLAPGRAGRKGMKVASDLTICLEIEDDQGQ